MRRSLIVAALIAAWPAFSPEALNAQTASASLTVTATVAKNCTITTAPVNFGPYDPVSANATSNLDGVGTITVTCTKGAMAKVGLNAGGNGPGTTTTRRMTQSATAYLDYEIYQDTGRATIWGDTVDTALDLGAAPNRNPRNFTVYGRVPSAQDATVGNYTDTVVATVNF